MGNDLFIDSLNESDIPLELKQILEDAPDNFVIQSALVRCWEITQSHNSICCSVSGGADSDVMVDMLVRCGAKDKTTFVYYDTGMEYQATKNHLNDLESKYKIRIHRERALKSVPFSVLKYGQPFWSKYASDMIYRLQSHDFKWEDKPFEDLILQYPKCKTALKWWCNVKSGKTTQYSIERAPYLKEFIMQNPPMFKISNKCCDYAKKKASAQIILSGDFDLSCTGVRQAEEGLRAGVYKTCFSEGSPIDSFRPLWWLRDNDKEQYCIHYQVEHSKCYSQYGLKRTGCVGCPFGKGFEGEVGIVRKYEPKLYRAVENLFGQSYDYTRQYLMFRDEMKSKQK